MSSFGQKKMNFLSKVLEIFNEVQRNISIHQTHVFQLLKYSQQDYELFMFSFEQAFLQIFHSFHSKANKKIPTKFQNLAESFFESALSKRVQQEIYSEESKKVLQIFNSFLALCSEGIYSTIMNIRVLCCRLVFMLVKHIPPKKMELYLKPQVQQALIYSTLHILRTKVSTYRQLGVKLASLILHFNSEKCLAIEKEMFKILALQDNEHIRKLVITNIDINKNNLENILIRLRDKNPQLRSVVVKKLQGQNFSIHQMSVNNLYKLLYDGYGSKELTVRKECLRYFTLYFIRQQQTDMMDQNQENRHIKFVQLFRPEILLLNPHLYYLLDELISDLLIQLQALMKQYILKACHQLKEGNISYNLIWVKNSINSKSRQIAKIYDEYGPTGVQLSRALLNASQRNQAFLIHQLLQLFGKQQMPDEIGRNSMFNSLKTLLVNLKYYEIHPDYTNFKDTDICQIMNKQQLNRKKLMLSYYDMPILSNSLDLIFQIGETMKSLRPQHYEIEMKQVMSEWHNPEENMKLKEKQIIQANIQKYSSRTEQNDNILARLKTQLVEIQNLIEQDTEKTRKVLMCISRLRCNCDLEIFMSIIKQQLSKEDRGNGLLLLGLYCLENRDKVTTFWYVFWQYISSTNTSGFNKNHLLVSLKVVVDFIVKFNSLNDDFKPDNVEDFNSDMFMNEMVRLMLHEDPEIRILAIQSLARLLFHERVDKQNEGTYFLYIILLWLETSTEITSAKSVHTVSIFIKSYIEKGNSYSLKLAQIFCLFFKVLSQFESEKKKINKQLINYNLSMDQFIKKTLFTVMTIFKYHKESRNVIWSYNPEESLLGPQQFLLLYLLRDERIMPFLGRSLSQCDFFQFCNIQILIVVKKAVEEARQTRKWKGNSEQVIKKLQQDIERQITLKKTETFNDHSVQMMQKENNEKMRLLQQESRYIHKNIEERGLFIKAKAYDSDDSEQSSSSQPSDDSQSQLSESSQKNIAERESEIRKRKKFEILSISDEDDSIPIKQRESEESVGLKKESKKGKNKKDLPIAPLRNLRKRK